MTVAEPWAVHASDSGGAVSRLGFGLLEDTVVLQP
jgi:hypothetical protein